jgi:hypothetical protein
MGKPKSNEDELDAKIELLREQALEAMLAVSELFASIAELRQFRKREAMKSEFELLTFTRPMRKH